MAPAAVPSSEVAVRALERWLDDELLAHSVNRLDATCLGKFYLQNPKHAPSLKGPGKAQRALRAHSTRYAMDGHMLVRVAEQPSPARSRGIAEL
jgi:hypothetical protein